MEKDIEKLDELGIKDNGKKPKLERENDFRGFNKNMGFEIRKGKLSIIAKSRPTN